MKRASLVVVPATKKAAAPDLTDRILARTPRRSHPPRRASAKRPAAAPKPKASAPLPTLLRPAPRPAPAVTPRAAGRSTVLAAALAQTQAAVEALAQAAHAAPARYEIGLRYRLDALAHHLRQVAEYVQSAANK